MSRGLLLTCGLLAAILLSVAPGPSARAVPVSYTVAGQATGAFGSLDSGAGPVDLSDVDLLLTVLFDTDNVVTAPGGSLTVRGVPNDLVRLSLNSGAGSFDLTLTGASSSLFVLNGNALVELQLNGTAGENVALGSVFLPGLDLTAHQVAAMAALFGPGSFATSGGLLSLDGVNGVDAVFTLNPIAAVPLPASLPLLLAAIGVFALLRRRRRV